MQRRPPRSTPGRTRFPYTTLFRSAQSGTRAKAGSGTLSYHTIKSGETLGSIAAKYKVTVKNLQSWNGLSNTRISAGKKLKIYK